MSMHQDPSAEASLATAKDVMAALTAIGVQAPDRFAISAISSVCRDDFLGALRSCVMRQDEDGSARTLIDNVVACVAPGVVDVLKKLRLVVELTDLIRIARFRPTRFLSAIAAAENQSHERHVDAVAFLRDFIASTCWLEVDGNDAPSAQQCAAGELPAAYDIPGLPPDPCAPPPSPREARQRPAESSRPPVQREAPPARAREEAKGKPAAQHVPPSPPPSAPAEKYRSHHVYGADYALCFNASVAPDGTPAVMVDAAAANGQRSYDWGNAIHILLDVREIACVLAVFRRWRTQVEFSAHGKRNDKAFSIAWQGAHFFCKVSARVDHKPTRAVKILPHDAVQVAVLFLEQLLLAYPHLPAGEVLALARAVNTIDDRQVANQ